MENTETIQQRNWFERFVLWCMNLLLKPFGKKLEGEAAEGFLQFVKFALVGVTNTVVSYLINAATLFILGKLNLFPNTDIYIGNTVAFFLSVLWAYMLSNKFVFNRIAVSRNVSHSRYMFSGCNGGGKIPVILN